MKTRHKQLNIKSIELSGRFLALPLLLLAIGIGSSRANTVLWSEGFEGYNTDSGQDYGSLDSNMSGGANEAPNGGSNPWFGPNPNNSWVTKAMINPVPIEETVTPHSGNFMTRGTRYSGVWYNSYDYDIDHVNISYRFHGGTAFKSNFSIDWWVYDMLGNTYPGDPDLGPGCFGDHAGIEYSTAAPTDTDYSNSGDIGKPGSGEVTARLALGAYEGTAGYDTSVYQVQVLGASDGEFGSPDNNSSNGWGIGWFNTSVTRSRGWHHAAITVDGNNMAVLSIDDTVVLTHATGTTDGFNVFTTTELQGTPDTYNQSAYYDDIKLSLITGPKIVSTSVSGTTDLVVNATDGLVGWTYKVVMSSDVTQPLDQWTPVATSLLTATGPFTIVANNVVSASNSKRFFAIRGAIQQ